MIKKIMIGILSTVNYLKKISETRKIVKLLITGKVTKCIQLDCN